MPELSELKLPDDNTIYSLTDETQTRSDHRHYESDLVPLVHKVYESTSYYTTVQDYENSNWYFISVVPDDWYKPWRVKFKFYSYCPNYPAYKSTTYSTITGRQDSIAYANWNELSTTAHYYVPVYPLTKTGFDAGYGHAIGISIYGASNYTKSAYYRTFEFDYLDCENCTVTILDTPVKWGSWTGTGSTNYGSLVSTNGYARGLQETGDNDDKTTIQEYYKHAVAGVNGLKKYSIFAATGENCYTSFTTDDGTGTKTYDTTTEFDLSKLYYFSNSSSIAAGTKTGNAYVVFCSTNIDMRYTLNGVTTSASTSVLSGDKPLYLVFTPTKGSYGKITSPYFLQDIATDGVVNRVYIQIGWMRNSYYCDLEPENKAYIKWVNPDDNTDIRILPWIVGTIGAANIYTCSYSEGRETVSSGYASHAEGYLTKASQHYAHAEGRETISSGHASHSEGYLTTASGYASHSEGSGCNATGYQAHAEGLETTASGDYGSHAEGHMSLASGNGSHAEGTETIASNDGSHVEGLRTISAGQYQHVFGKYNIEDSNSTYIEIVGNGNSIARSNARTLDWNGNESLKGNLKFPECQTPSSASDYPVNMTEPGIIWKESGYGDKFEIKPKFYGTGNENKLLFNAATGGANTDPDVKTVGFIDPTGEVGFGNSCFISFYNVPANLNSDTIKLTITFPSQTWAKYMVEVYATANFNFIHSEVFVGTNGSDAIDQCGYKNETPSWTTVSGCSAVTNNTALTWTANKNTRTITSSAFARYGMVTVKIISSVNPASKMITVSTIEV